MEEDYKAVHPWLTTALFLAVAAAYIHSAGPGGVAYRDSGEMVVALHTLGVPHPPGYPLYVLAGSAAVRLPLGCVALRASYFSAIAGAAAIALLFVFLRRLSGTAVAAVAAVALAFSNPLWELSAVPEMYALGALFLAAVLYAGHIKRSPALTGFLFGLSLGVRLDMLLLLPAFVWPFRKDARALGAAAVSAVGGASIFLFLPIRSAQQPLLDWGDPETAESLWAAVTRRSYGGSLDLLSQSYARGTNFVANLPVFGSRLLGSAGPLGIAAAVAGLVVGRRDHKDVWSAALIAFVLSGPVFLFMANLPPNPHAVAVVEASFVVPMVFLAIFLSLGLASLKGKLRPAGAALMTVMVAVSGAEASTAAVKRSAWSARDYIEAVLRSAPRSAIVVFREDVQLFGLWQAQIVDGRRPDLRVISYGLSGSPWYWAMAGRWPGGPVPAVSLKEPNGFLELLKSGRPVCAGFDSDVPANGSFVLAPQGLVRRAMAPGQPMREDVLDKLHVYRVRTWMDARDFFSEDLLADVARSGHFRGLGELQRNPTRSDGMLRFAQSRDPDFPSAVADRAYLRMAMRDFRRAAELYEEAADGYRDLLSRSVRYRSLPSAVEPIRDGLSTALNHRGVAFERMGRIDAARASYEESIKVKPTASAHYNLAVTYWGRDWRRAAENFGRATTLDPSFKEARKFGAEAASRAATER